MLVTSRLPEVGTTIFSVMSALAQQHGAINLSQGFPDFDAPRELFYLLDQHARAGHNQYAPMTGVPVLREAIAAKATRSSSSSPRSTAMARRWCSTVARWCTRA